MKHMHPIQIRRRRLLWTVDELASKAGFKSSSIIKSIEAGICNTTPQRLEGFSKAFGVPIDSIRKEIAAWELVEGMNRAHANDRKPHRRKPNKEVS